MEHVPSGGKWIKNSDTGRHTRSRSRERRHRSRSWRRRRPAKSPVRSRSKTPKEKRRSKSRSKDKDSKKSKYSGPPVPSFMQHPADRRHNSTPLSIRHILISFRQIQNKTRSENHLIGLVLDISCEVSSKADDDDFQFRVRHALRYFIQDSHILKIDPTCSSFYQNLLNILDRKHWGLLEPSINHPKPTIPTNQPTNQPTIPNQPSQR